MSLRWTWAEPPVEPLRVLARRLGQGWTPGEDGLIKRGSGREVWRVPAASGAVLLKRFVVPPARRALHLLRPSRAAAEYRAARALAEAGIPTASALGFGERRASGLLREAWFLGRFVPDAVTLGNWMCAASRDGRHEEAQAATVRALALVARLHRVPWRHRDLHADNLLRTADGTLRLIDLHSMRRVARVTPSLRSENLARLLFSFREALDLRTAPELLQAYLREAGDLPAAFLPETLAALDGFELDYVRGRTARCVRQSTLYAVERHAEGRLFRRRRYPVACLDAALTAHRALLDRGGHDVLGSAPRTCVTRVPMDGDAHCIVKEYLPAGPGGALRQRLGRGRARSAWMGARRLEVLDIPTPPALALLERRDGSAVLVTGAAVDAISLRAFLTGLGQSPRARDRADVAAQVGWLVGRLARAGVRHDDLSTKNILLEQLPPGDVRDVRDRPPAGAWRALLIDLDNLCTMPRHDGSGLTRMLTQLFDVPAWVSRSDRRRFERAFAATAGRPLAGEVVRAAVSGAAARARRRHGQARPGPTRAARLGDPPAPATGVTE